MRIRFPCSHLRYAAKSLTHTPATQRAPRPRPQGSGARGAVLHFGWRGLRPQAWSCLWPRPADVQADSWSRPAQSARDPEAQLQAAIADRVADAARPAKEIGRAHV